MDQGLERARKNAQARQAFYDALEEVRIDRDSLVSLLSNPACNQVISFLKEHPGKPFTVFEIESRFSDGKTDVSSLLKELASLNLIEFRGKAGDPMRSFVSLRAS